MMHLDFYWVHTLTVNIKIKLQITNASFVYGHKEDQPATTLLEKSSSISHIFTIHPYPQA